MNPHWEYEEAFIAWRLERRQAIQQLPLTDHAKQRMDERRVTPQHVYYALTHGRIFEGYGPHEYPRGPEPYQNPDEVRSMRCVMNNGRVLVIAIALQITKTKARYSILTVYWTE